MTNAAAGRQEIYSNRSWSWRPTLFMFAAHCSIVVVSEGPKWRVNKQTALSRTCPSSCWSGEKESTGDRSRRQWAPNAMGSACHRNGTRVEAANCIKHCQDTSRALDPSKTQIMWSVIAQILTRSLLQPESASVCTHWPPNWSIKVKKLNDIACELISPFISLHEWPPNDEQNKKTNTHKQKEKTAFLGQQHWS